MFYLRHRRHRKNIRKELIEVIQDARYRFNGDTRHDSHVVHQAIYNYWLDKKVAYSSFLFKPNAETEFRHFVNLLRLLFKECDRAVRLYCVNTDGSDDGLFGRRKEKRTQDEERE